jgi:hypothetical protein
VELLLTPPKVPRRAVRILVLTVRPATARRRRVPLGWLRTGPLPALTGAGRSSVFFGGSRVPDPSLNSLTQGAFRPAKFGTLIESEIPPRGAIRPGGRSKGRGRSRSVLHDCRLSRWLSQPSLLRPGPQQPPSRDCHRADMVPNRREEETSVVSHQTGRVESSR